MGAQNSGDGSPHAAQHAGSLHRLHDVLTIRDYFRVIGRHKAMVLFAALIGCAVGLLVALTQAVRYEASAEVLLSRHNLAASLTGTPDPTQYQQAQRYVRVLRDDPSAGFEGYQVVGSGALDEEELAQVDLQVQALWATLVHEWQLGYINPPPTYSAALDSQRLRTPSGVQRNAAGTCLDLALLFAACLELVDIYPVVFLLEGHALPGYWRHHSFHEQFAQAAYPQQGAPLVPAERSSSAGIQKFPWQTLGQEAHRELARAIESRQLVPLETVRLTEYCGFVAAIEAGVEALAAPQDFHSMLDIVRARQWGVTPLPIVEDAS